MQNHLAILHRTHLDLILSGAKTIECRLSRMGSIPYGFVQPGDLLWMKESAGPVRAVAAARTVRCFENLTPARLDWIRRRFNAGIQAPAPFWRQHRDVRFATLIWLDSVCALEPFGVKKTDRRPWVVLGAPPVPGARLVTVPFGLD